LGTDETNGEKRKEMSTSNGTLNNANRINEVSGRKATRKASKGKKLTPQRARYWLTIAMGTFIPLLSLTLSHVGGTLVHGDTVQCCLGLAAFGLMGCVLWVSLSHLAWSIQDVTKSSPGLSWLMAVATDLALVLGELVHVNADELGLCGLVWALMICVCLLSMVLNCWAFLSAKSHKGSK
jgi:cation transport ATPase